MPGYVRARFRPRCASVTNPALSGENAMFFGSIREEVSHRCETVRKPLAPSKQSFGQGDFTSMN